MDKRKNIEDIYPLSSMQQGILFHSLSAPKSGMYIAQMRCTFGKSLNVLALKQAWQLVVERHSVLRTSFHGERREQPFQVVHRQIELPWEQYDWQNVRCEQQQELLQNFLQADRQRDFDLSQPPLMCLTLIQLAEDNYQFVWSKHHLILDGWSTALVFKEVFEIYGALDRGNDLPLSRSRPYGDYIAWLRQQDLAAAEAFWRDRLQGFTAPTPFRVDRNNISTTESDHDEQQIQLSAATTTTLKSLAQRHQLTLNTLIQGAFALLLSRYSGAADIVFGATTSGRPPTLAGVESMVGVLIDTLPVRVQVNSQALLIPWLQQLQAQQAEARQYEYSPLVEIQAWSDVPRGMPLFESIVVFENYPVDSALLRQGEKLGMRELRFVESINYPLTVVVVVGSELSLNIWYHRQRFDAATIARLLQHLRTLLAGMVANPHQPLNDLQLLTAAERQQLLVEWNNTSADYPQDVCIHHLFEAQVERVPDAIALVFERQQLTYRQLNQRAERLAFYLRDLGVAPGVLVGICVERSLDLVVGLLGILKAGGAYLPLDPAYPRERLAFILEAAQAQVLLTQEQLVQVLPEHQAKVVCLDTDWEAIAPAREPDDLDNGISAADLAYVIYTSGSTGQPKGVQIPHRAVVNFLDAMRHAPGLTEQDTLLSVTTLSFDIAALELFLPLTVGACLVVASREVAADGIQLAATLTNAQVTVMQATPATWQLLLAMEWQGNKQLKILCGGEALDRELATRLLERGAALWNLYGPTETTIWSTAYKVDLENSTICIGSPIGNTQIYLLDRDLQPVPVGVPGELYIGGAGLAWGYLNQPELTAEKFIPNPYSSDRSSPRLYKTGDLARYLPDGNIEYLGRIDYQVKLRGFRIELGEIEAVIGQYPGVRQSVVLAREDEPDNKRLVAYLVPHEGQNLSTSDLRSFLQTKLPHYMVPSAYVMLEALPLTPNGKVNRRALPPPATVAPPELAAAYVAPRTEIERIIATVWQNVLKVEKVGIHDNFFDIGGHSLRMVQVYSQLRQILPSDLSMVDLFRYPTIDSLAKFFSRVPKQESLSAQETSDRVEKFQEGKSRLQQVLKKSKIAK